MRPVIQFNENHKWCGTLGIMTEAKQYEDDTRFMIAVPMPEQGTAYIFSMLSHNEFDWIGETDLVPA